MQYFAFSCMKMLAGFVTEPTDTWLLLRFEVELLRLTDVAVDEVHHDVEECSA